ncbi:ABC transporter substrate-binding protein [Brachyspira sp.]|uniref:ABC transporter substrate-binding protein n=1 Tax=Brachyspira sp. TaxID=1977261 RepID=UPI003D7E4D27
MKRIIITILFVLGLFYGCSTEKSDTGENSLVIYSPHPLSFLNALVDDFKAKNPGINVELIGAGSGELLKRVESEKDNPLGDVLWGGTVTIVKPKAFLFEDFATTNSENIPYKNIEGPLTRCTVVPSILMVNTNLAKNIKIEGYEDLLNPALKGKIAFADPAAAQSPFEHLVNMLYAMGGGDTEKGWDYIRKFCANLDGKLLSGSSATYKGVADGEYTVGLTFEQGGVDYVAWGSPVKVVYMKEGVISKPDGVYIIKGAKNMENAKRFVDYITSYDAQKMINEKLNRRAVRSDLPPSDLFVPIEDINIIYDDEDLVVANKQKWLDKFRDIFTSI